MVNRLLLVSALIILMLCISGCTDEQTPDSGQDITDITDTDIIDTEDTTDNGDAADTTGLTPEELAVVDELPGGYEYLGSPTLSVEKVKRDYVDVSGIVAAAEGLYMAGEIDLYVDVIELESPGTAEGFVSEYRSGFRELPSGTRFAEDSFNGHSVTRIKTYATIGAEEVPRYTYIWSNGSFVFVVGGATEDHSMLRTLAEATGY